MTKTCNAGAPRHQWSRRELALMKKHYLRATGGGESGFISSAIGASNLPAGIASITRHRIKG